MDHYLEEILKVAQELDVKDLAAAASDSLSANVYSEKLLQSMKWSLSVKPSSVPQAGNVAAVMRSNLQGVFLTGHIRPGTFLVALTPLSDVDRDPRHRVSASAHRGRSVAGRVWAIAAVLPAADKGEVGLEILELRRADHRQHWMQYSFDPSLRRSTHQPHCIGSRDQSPLRSHASRFEAERDGRPVRVLEVAGTEVRSVHPESLYRSGEIHVQSCEQPCSTKLLYSSRAVLLALL